MGELLRLLWHDEPLLLDVPGCCEQEEQSDLFCLFYVYGRRGLGRERAARRHRVRYGTCCCCFGSLPLAYFASLHGCSRVFCHSCLRSTVQSHMQSQHTLPSCGYGCPLRRKPPPLDMSAMREVLDEDTLRKLQDRVLVGRLVTMPDVRFCPQPRCGNAMVVSLEEGCRNVRCEQCGNGFCRDCHERWHDGVGDGSCAAFKRVQYDMEWKGDDDHFEQDAEDNDGKQCPRCRVYTVKNGGCSHMTCFQCGLDYCWNCNGYYSWAKPDVEFAAVSKECTCDYADYDYAYAYDDREPEWIHDDDQDNAEFLRVFDRYHFGGPLARSGKKNAWYLKKCKWRRRGRTHTKQVFPSSHTLRAFSKQTQRAVRNLQHSKMPTRIKYPAIRILVQRARVA